MESDASDAQTRIESAAAIEVGAPAPATLDEPAVPTETVAPGTTIGRYVVVEHLGAGAMARVLLAYDTKLHREVAIKLLRVSDEDASVRAVREARALAQLGHPNVVAVFDVDRHTDAAGRPHVFVAMEYVRGRTLADILRTPQPWPEALSPFIQIGRGLAAAHAAGLVHRDVKPSNVLVGDDGRVRVGDFGLARADPSDTDSRPRTSASWDQSVTRADTVIGTPAYMAPEQHDGRALDARADQYGYCVSLWEALHGARPFVASDVSSLLAAKRRGPPPRPHDDVPAWLHAIVARGLAVAPGDRWPSLTRLVDALERDPTRGRWRLIAAATVGVAIAGVVVVRRVQDQRERDRCVASGERIGDVWDTPRRERVVGALRAIDPAAAEDTLDRVLPRFDAYAREWADAVNRACIAHAQGALDPADHDLVIGCYDERRDNLRAMVDALAAADDRKALHSAVSAAVQLPPLIRCEDAVRLRAQPRPPDGPEIAEEIDEVERMLADARALELAGAPERARAAADLALSRAEAIGWAPLHARALIEAASAADGHGDHDTAARHLGLAFLTAGGAGADAIAFSAAERLAFLEVETRRRIDEAERWASLAEMMLARTGADALLAPALGHAWGFIHYRAGRYPEAIAAFEAVAAQIAEIYGPDHLKIAAALNSLAMVHIERGAPEQALAPQTRAIELLEQTLGPGHPRVAAALNNLGALHHVMGDDVRSLETLQRAQRIATATLGEHPLIAATWVGIGNARLALGDAAASRAAFEHALALRERSFGPDHVEVAIVVHNLGNALREQGEYAPALAAYRRALAIRQRSLPDDHPDLADSYDDIGVIQLEHGVFEEAVAMLESALDARERGEATAVDRSATRFALARALDAAGRDRTRALTLAGRARDELGEGAKEVAQRATIDAWIRERS